MEHQKLAEEFCEMHFLYAGKLDHLSEQISAIGEERVLFWLDRASQKVLSGELAKNLDLTSGRMANILRNLERKGYIHRENDIIDRRKVYVRLTDSGKNHFTNTYQETFRQHEKLLNSLGDQDAAEFIRLLKKAYEFASKEKA
ncbi:MAG: winged helix DNA-binding protein [Eubacteriales bacterium]|nr:winged helix DNA-binding protein [Eubacteriales bacterium]